MLFIGTLFLRLLFDFFSFAALYFLAHTLFQALCRWGKIKSPCVLPLLLFSQEELEAYSPAFLRIPVRAGCCFCPLSAVLFLHCVRRIPSRPRRTFRIQMAFVSSSVRQLFLPFSCLVLFSSCRNCMLFSGFCFFALRQFVLPACSLDVQFFGR